MPTCVKHICCLYDELALKVAICGSQGWREVQRELLHLVCNYLNREARWAMRQVSPHWRESTEQFQNIVFRATAQTLGSTIAILHAWRQGGRLCRCSFDFSLSTPVSLKDLARLLEDLTNQVAYFSLIIYSLLMYQMQQPLLHLMLHCVLQLDSLTTCRIDSTLLVA